MDTERLIRTLAETAAPVRPLSTPESRAAQWALAAGTYVLLLVIVVPPHTEPGARLQDLRFLLEQGAAVLTGVTAAFAALATAIPGHRRSVVMLPIACALVWIATAGAGALRGDQQASSTLLQMDWRCVPATLIGAAFPAALIMTMLRRAAPLTPRLTAGLGALAAAGVGNIGICFFHPHNSPSAGLIWHCGTALLVAGAAGIAGGALLHWPMLNLSIDDR